MSAINKSLESSNWLAALFVALSMPDICGKIESPNQSSPKRYAFWFDKYVGDKYIGYLGPQKEKHIFLSGNDCYALRCSLLHEGHDDISKQRAKEALEKFHFIEPQPNKFIHNNQYGNVLQLQIDVFCNDISNAVKKWDIVTSCNQKITSRKTKLLQLF